MDEPVKMVFVSAVALIILILGLFTYRYIYPRKRISPVTALILISILPLISIVRPGSYESGDLSRHATDGMSFFQSLVDGDLIPTWGKDVNATYGHPVFLFSYPLPYYLISLFHLIGFSFIDSVKLLLASSFIVSGLGFFLWIRKEVGKNIYALIGALFYLFFPYHLVNLHFRADVGEIVAMCVAPFLLLSISRLRERVSPVRFISGAVITALLILSHQAVSLMVIGFTTLYVFFNFYIYKKSSVFLWCSLMMIILGVLFSAFYWLPLIYNFTYTHHDYYVRNVIFLRLTEILFSPWRYGLLFQGPNGELSFLLGYVQLGILVASIYALIFKKIRREYIPPIFFYVILIAVTTITILEVSRPLWEVTPLVRGFQFTYRLMAIQAIFTSALAAFALKAMKRHDLSIIICIIMISSTILNWGNRRNVPLVNDSVLHAKMPLSTSEIGEGLHAAVPKWSDSDDPWLTEIPNNHIEVISGKGEARVIERKTNYHKYELYAHTPVIVRENTLYYPGWNLIVDNKPSLFEILKEHPKGVIQFELEKGPHIIELKLTDQGIMFYSKLISIGAFLGALFIVLGIYFKKFLLLMKD